MYKALSRRAVILLSKTSSPKVGQGPDWFIGNRSGKGQDWFSVETILLCVSPYSGSGTRSRSVQRKPFRDSPDRSLGDLCFLRRPATVVGHDQDRFIGNLSGIVQIGPPWRPILLGETVLSDSGTRSGPVFIGNRSGIGQDWCSVETFLLCGDLYGWKRDAVKIGSSEPFRDSPDRSSRDLSSCKTCRREWDPVKIGSENLSGTVQIGL